MNELVIVAFPTVDGAVDALKNRWHADRFHSLSLRHACVVRCDAHGALSYHRVRDVTPRDVEWYGGIIGYLIGCLLLVPIVFGHAEDDILVTPLPMDFTDDFTGRLRAALTPSTSAVAFVVAGPMADKAVAEAARLGGTTIHEDISEVTEAAIEAALSGARSETP